MTSRHDRNKHSFFTRAVLCALLNVSLIIVCLPNAHADVSAQVNSDEVTIEQSLTLTITSNQTDGAPDISVLEKDFEILGSSTESHTQITNGQAQQSRSWIFELIPRREGIIQIPAFKVGRESSKPFRIRVKPPAANAGNVFGSFKVEVDVDTVNPYVQSQVVFTIRVFYAVNLLEGNLSAPEAPDLIVESVGDDRQYQENIQGKRYRVLERKFALFPQKSGPLELPAIVLDANVPADGSARRTYFTPMRKVRRRSDPVTLEVLPRPAANGNAWWLPAKAIKLQARWEGDATQVRVGDSLTRSIELIAEGVDSTQLPEIPVPESQDYKVYVDQPELGRLPNANGLQSARVEKWAIVARKAGPLTLPAIEVPWFNTATGKMEVASLAATSIEILPPETDEVGADGSPVDSNANGSAMADRTTKDQTGADTSAQLIPAATVSERLIQPIGQTSGSSLWKWVALASIAAWLITSGILARLLFKRRAPNTDQTVKTPVLSRTISLSDVKKACQSGDLKRSASTILAWAREQWPEDPPGTLMALAKRVQSPELKNDLGELDSALYAGTPAPATLGQLADLLGQTAGKSHAGSMGYSKGRVQSNLPEL